MIIFVLLEKLLPDTEPFIPVTSGEKPGHRSRNGPAGCWGTAAPGTGRIIYYTTLYTRLHPCFSPSTPWACTSWGRQESTLGSGKSKTKRDCIVTGLFCIVDVCTWSYTQHVLVWWLLGLVRTSAWTVTMAAWSPAAVATPLGRWLETIPYTFQF